ncbi:hypothetical protein GDO86_002299, partial [Hymenochirus boettgeri]
FRHSPNCFYLRDWTIHCWIRQCLKYGALDKALYTLKNKVQYGIFPESFTFNLLLDAFIKEENYQDAVSVVTELMLQESFDRVSTQLLSLYALYKYLSEKPELKWDQERNVGASLFLAGLQQENTVGYSSQLYGYALLGKVELCYGLRSVYNQMPLMWTPGYFKRALNVMEKVLSLPGDIKICRDSIDILKECLNLVAKALEERSAENAEDVKNEESAITENTEKTEADFLLEYLNRFQLVQEKMLECEQSDLEKYEQQLKEWEKRELH